MQKQTLYDFVEAINRHDVERLYELMHDDFVFIDAYGGEDRGRDVMKEGWRGYFEWFPDYRIEIDDLFEKEDTLAFFGYAGGTYHNLQTADKRYTWRLPAAWKAVVKQGKICLWQVCCDSKIPYEIMGRHDFAKQ